jgi:hypothetical protein
MANPNGRADAEPVHTAMRHQLEAPEEDSVQTPGQRQEEAEFENTRKRLARELGVRETGWENVRLRMFHRPNPLCCSFYFLPIRV